MPLPRVQELFSAHLNPAQLHFMKLLGFDKILVERAEGMHYITRDGRRILDFFGGFGSLAFGHNHPRIIAARQKFQEEQRHEIAIAFLSQYASALAYNLAEISPDPLSMVFFGSSGSEAMEAAIKVAEQAQGPGRAKIVYAENAFHGKTKGTLSLTDSPLYRSKFKLVENTIRVPFGDIEALKAAIEADRGDRHRRDGDDPGRRRHRRGAGGVLAAIAERSATSTAFSGSPTKCNAASGGPGASMPSNMQASCPT